MQKNWQRAATRAVAMAVVALVAGCGGESTDEDIDFVDYQPLDAGARWTYRTSDGQTSFSESLRVVGGASLPGVGPGTVVEHNMSGEAPYRFVYVKGAGGLTRYAYDRNDPEETAFDDWLQYRLPIRLGEVSVQRQANLPTTDLDGDGIGEILAFTGTVTPVGFESAVTPYAVFRDSLHMRQVQRSTMVYSADGRQVVIDETVIDTWYAPNFGMVRGTLVSTDGTSNVTELTGRDTVAAAPSDATRSSANDKPRVRSVFSALRAIAPATTH